MTRCTGAQALVRALLQHNTEVLFGYPGGAIMPVYDALYEERQNLRHILVRHEQGAAHAAEGYARVTGRPGVCIATSGPGATNLITGLADAMMDSVPLIAITGQVHKKLLGTDAFQETDIIGMTIPVTKWSYQITSASEIQEVVGKAFEYALSGRPGPVLIDITKNAQVEECQWYSSFPPVKSRKHITHTPSQLQEAADLLNTAQKPLILSGHGVLIANASKILQQVAEKGSFPVACTLHGLTSFPKSHPLNVGLLGMHGNVGPNVLTAEADLIFAIGMRFDDRVTGDLSRYAPKAKVIHIDIDPAELGKNVPTAVSLCGDAKTILEDLLPLLYSCDRTQWRDSFHHYQTKEDEKVLLPHLFAEDGPLSMTEVVYRLSEQTKGEAIIVADVGQHQMATARYTAHEQPRSWISSGGLGTMGFGLPAALGAAVASPKKQVIACMGDGGFQMNLQELGTIAQENLPVKMVIFNNSYLGMVRQWQELFFERRYSFVDLHNPDFVALAKAYGISGKRVTTREELNSGVKEMLTSSTAYLLEVIVAAEENVFPMIPVGASTAEIRLEK